MLDESLALDGSLVLCDEAGEFYVLPWDVIAARRVPAHLKEKVKARTDDADVQGYTAKYQTNYPTSATQPTDPPEPSSTPGQSSGSGAGAIPWLYLSGVPLQVIHHIPGH
jgi:hypothetical protein